MNLARLFTAVAIAGIVLLGANPATATSVKKFSVKELTKLSDSIVLARVEGVTGRWDEGKKEIYTYVTLTVTEDVKKGNRSPRAKGSKDETTITIRQLGGSVDNIISAVPGMPRFRVGEEVVLFLSKNDAAGYPWVMGLQQGKYTVVTDERGRKHVRNDIDGLSLLSPDGKTSDVRVSGELPLNAFLDGIKTDLDVAGKVKVDPTNPTPIK